MTIECHLAFFNPALERFEFSTHKRNIFLARFTDYFSWLGQNEMRLKEVNASTELDNLSFLLIKLNAKRSAYFRNFL